MPPDPPLQVEFDECRSATADLIRAVQAFAGTLAHIHGDFSGPYRSLELQKVLVDEAHSRFLYVTEMLLQQLRES
jgi:hypothetical protein